MITNTLQTLNVLIVERHRSISESVASIVAGLASAQVVEARAVDEALKVAESLSPDVALVDLELSPSCSLVSRLKELSPHTRIVVLADRDSDHPESLVKALASGAVGAIYRDPASLEDLARAIHSSSQRPVVAEEATGLLLHSYTRSLAEKHRRDHSVIIALATAVETRDFGTGLHLHRVTELARRCMLEIDRALAANEDVQYGFMLHDVGKIGVPDSILQKPGPLTSHEWVVMRSHPELGVKIVEPIGFSSTTTDIILRHHERWDGLGYPNGLRGPEIPLAARAFAVADAYDAMTSNRPYRAAMAEGDAIAIIESERGRAFDPEIVDVFLSLYL